MDALPGAGPAADGTPFAGARGAADRTPLAGACAPDAPAAVPGTWAQFPARAFALAGIGAGSNPPGIRLGDAGVPAPEPGAERLEAGVRLAGASVRLPGPAAPAGTPGMLLAPGWTVAADTPPGSAGPAWCV